MKFRELDDNQKEKLYIQLTEIVESMGGKGKFFSMKDEFKEQKNHILLNKSANGYYGDGKIKWGKGRYWEEGKWIETEPMEIKMVWDYPEVGPKDSYLLYHEELESLCQNIKGLKRIRFFMTFGESYLTHMKCLENVGMLRIDEVEVNGVKVVPLQLLKELLPDPASLGPRTVGKTNIGCVIEGIKDGKKKKVYIYNTCDHQECYKETNAQAVSYTTGVPAMIGAKLLLEGKWSGEGVFNMEQLDAKPFMDELMLQGLPWKIIDMDVE
jgi:saccharopine dehydrogenase (NAD+, L-lysine-forming)